jgi:hypothetical protein
VLLYVYFHIGLLRIWELMSGLPAVFPEGTPLDHRVSPWLLTGLLRSRLRLLRFSRPPLARLQKYVSMLLAYWLAPITLAGYWIRYLPRHDWLGSSLQASLIIVCIGFAYTFSSLCTTELAHRPPAIYVQGLLRISIIAVSGSLCLGLITFGSIEGVRPFSTPNTEHYLPVLSHLDPRAWVPKFWLWIKFDRFANVSESGMPRGLRGPHDQPVNAPLLFSNANLRFSSGVGVQAPNANFRSADLSYSQFDSANLREADFEGAILRGASFVRADLTGANLKDADLLGTDLSETSGLIAAQTYAAKHWQFAFRPNLHDGTQASCQNRRRKKASTNFRGAEIKLEQIRAMVGWRTGFYDPPLLTALGLPPDHNERVKNARIEGDDLSGANAFGPWTCCRS